MDSLAPPPVEYQAPMDERPRDDSRLAVSPSIRGNRPTAAGQCREAPVRWVPEDPGRAVWG